MVSYFYSLIININFYFFILSWNDFSSTHFIFCLILLSSIGEFFFWRFWSTSFLESHIANMYHQYFYFHLWLVCFYFYLCCCFYFICWICIKIIKIFLFLQFCFGTFWIHFMRFGSFFSTCYDKELKFLHGVWRCCSLKLTERNGSSVTLSYES